MPPTPHSLTSLGSTQGPEEVDWRISEPQAWLCPALPSGEAEGAPSGCGAGRALGTVPSCRELAGAIRVYISMIFLPATAAHNEAEIRRSPGMPTEHQRDGPILK